MNLYFVIWILVGLLLLETGFLIGTGYVLAKTFKDINRQLSEEKAELQRERGELQRERESLAGERAGLYRARNADKFLLWDKYLALDKEIFKTVDLAIGELGVSRSTFYRAKRAVQKYLKMRKKV